MNVIIGSYNLLSLARGILAPIEQQEQDHLWAAGKHGMEMCVCAHKCSCGCQTSQ
jgi:hypothetical protein